MEMLGPYNWSLSHFKEHCVSWSIFVVDIVEGGSVNSKEIEDKLQDAITKAQLNPAEMKDAQESSDEDSIGIIKILNRRIYIKQHQKK